MNPKNDSLRHLATYLCNFAKEFLEPTSIRCRLDVPTDLPDIPLTTEVRHNVFLVAKEALNNAVRHSGATEIWLRMAVNGGDFTLEVADNGRGFAVEASAGGVATGCGTWRGAWRRSADSCRCAARVGKALPLLCGCPCRPARLRAAAAGRPPLNWGMHAGRQRA